jgi:NIPSNAP
MKRVVLPGLLLSAWLISLGTGEKASADKTAPNRTRTEADVKAVGSNRVFELRTYITNEGKLEALHKRFHDHTCRLLKKHGAQLIGFWTPLDKEHGKGSKLVYLVAFPSREAAKTTWDSFQKDPEWQKAYEESHKDGKLVKTVESVFLEPTEYSEMK